MLPLVGSLTVASFQVAEARDLDGSLMGKVESNSSVCL
jgi:hypothetical protein